MTVNQDGAITLWDVVVITWLMLIATPMGWVLIWYVIHRLTRRDCDCQRSEGEQ